MKARSGEIWLVDLGLAAKTRPILIVSRDDQNPPRALILYLPLTTQFRGSAYEVEIGRPHFLNEHSYANIQGLGSISATRLERFLGKLSPELMTKVKDAMRFALEL